MAKKQVKITPPPDASFPLSSMIDVVFLLLIFFLVTQRPITEEVPMNVELPAPDLNSNPADAPTLITIEVSENTRDNIDDIEKHLASLKEGETVADVLEKEERLYYRFNNTEMESRTISDHLKNFHDAQSSPTIIISCSPDVRFRKLIRLLDLCNKYEMDSLQLVNKP